MIKPITREESYLSKLAGMESQIPDKPITRKEMYLSRLCLKEGAIPERPITREEVYLAKLCGESVTLPSPITRLEKFMSAAAGVSVSKPTPITREDYLWDKYRTEPEPIPRTIDWTPIIHITDALAKPVVDLKVKITPVQPGTGDPSPDNVRPISGWTGANVARAGSNLAEFTDGYGINADGVVTPQTGRFATINPIPINPNITYYIQVGSSSVVSFIIAVFNGSTLVRRTAAIRSDLPLDTSGGTELYVCGYRSTGITIADCNPMVKATSDTLNYSPYTGTTYPITFPAEAGTVYGGEVDVTSGVLTVTMAEVDLGTLNLKFLPSANRAAVSIADVYQKTSWSTHIGLCSCYLEGRIANNSGDAIGFAFYNNYLYIRDPRFTGDITTEQIQSLLSGQILIYQLATPLTYHLTPTEVTTLLGVNNVWADTGDSKLTYLADPNSPEPVQATRALRTLATVPVVEETEAEPEEPEPDPDER